MTSNSIQQNKAYIGIKGCPGGRCCSSLFNIIRARSREDVQKLFGILHSLDIFADYSREEIRNGQWWEGEVLLETVGIFSSSAFCRLATSSVRRMTWGILRV